MSADEHPDREAVMDATDTERKARREERGARREIPDEWVAVATDALRDYWALASGVDTGGEARAVIAAVRPLIEREARKKLADLIASEVGSAAADIRSNGVGEYDAGYADALTKVAASLRERGRDA